MIFSFHPSTEMQQKAIKLRATTAIIALFAVVRGTYDQGFEKIEGIFFFQGFTSKLIIAMFSPKVLEYFVTGKNYCAILP